MSYLFDALDVNRPLRLKETEEAILVFVNTYYKQDHRELLLIQAP